MTDPWAPQGGGEWEGQGQPAPASQDSRNMAMLAHLLGIISGFIGPLIIWLIKKDQDPYIDYHGKEALNFTITLFILHLICFVLWIILIGVVLSILLWLGSIVLFVLAGLAAGRGEYYRYPFAIRFLK